MFPFPVLYHIMRLVLRVFVNRAPRTSRTCSATRRSPAPAQQQRLPRAEGRNANNRTVRIRPNLLRLESSLDRPQRPVRSTPAQATPTHSAIAPTGMFSLMRPGRIAINLFINALLWLLPLYHNRPLSADKSSSIRNGAKNKPRSAFRARLVFASWKRLTLHHAVHAGLAVTAVAGLANRWGGAPIVPDPAGAFGVGYVSAFGQRAGHQQA